MFVLQVHGPTIGISHLDHNMSNTKLCLVPVKYFSENKYFPEMLFLGKENIFKCLVTL